MRVVVAEKPENMQLFTDDTALTRNVSGTMPHEHTRFRGRNLLKTGRLSDDVDGDDRGA